MGALRHEEGNDDGLQDRRLHGCTHGRAHGRHGGERRRAAADSAATGRSMQVQAEIAGNKNDHDDDADNGEDVHVAAPLDRDLLNSQL